MSRIFGERLKKLRCEWNLLQSDLAKELSLDRSTIGYWERGKQEPSFENLIKLCEILETTPNYLLGFDDE